MELITGKNKEEFDRWISTSKELKVIFEIINHAGISFKNLPFEMQSGVITAYYLSIGYEIESTRWINDKFELTGLYEVCIFDYTKAVFLIFEVRNFDVSEALKAAYKQANDLRNKIIEQKQ